jgi:hypothetical protein
MKKDTIVFGLLIVFAIFATSVLQSCRIDSRGEIDENLNVLHEKTFNISPGKLMKLDASSGDVIVNTWDKPQVYIKVLGNNRAERKVDFSFKSTDDFVAVIAEHHNNFFNWFGNSIRMKFEITIPTNFSTKIKTSGGDIEITGITGDQNMKTSGGDVLINNVTGNLTVSTSGGEITTTNTKGESDLSTSGGQIKCTDFEGDFNASTSGGDIVLSGKNSKINAHTSGGDIDITYQGENKGIDIGTSGGDIKLNLPEDFNASASLSTSGGSITCTLNTTNISKITSSKFVADLNKGGNELIAKTSGGDIEVVKNH